MFDCPGQHMAFGDDWFFANVFEPHLQDDDFKRGESGGLLRRRVEAKSFLAASRERAQAM